MLQSLRGDQLIASEGRSVEILDWEGLAAAAGFDDGYLHPEALSSGRGTGVADSRA